MTKDSKSRSSSISLEDRLSALKQHVSTVEHVAVSRLNAYAENPRRHPEKQITKLMASISEFGFLIPVLVDDDCTIIAGEARAEAARRLGMSLVPAIFAGHLSKAQIKAYRIADNRLAELSHWDEGRLAIEFAEILAIGEVGIDLVGFETAQVDIIMEHEESPKSKEDPADEQMQAPKVAVSRAGDLWQLGKHRLICGSALDVEVWDRLLDGAKARMAFTDSPFNVPVSGHVCGLGKVQHAEFAMASGEMSRSEFVQFLVGFLEPMIANVVDGAIIDLCMDWRHLSELLEALDRVGLSLINLCVWNKSNGGMGSLYRSKHELVLIAKKGKAPHINNVQLGKHGRYRCNTWDYPGVNSFGANRMADLADHPTVKPVALVADAIRDVTNPGDIVLDAFLGSGTTLLAAERTRRIGYGIEIEPSYVDVAIRRWEKMTRQAAVLSTTGQTFAEIATERLKLVDAA